MGLPLEGVRVLDLSRVWAVPGAGMMLADQGADVIKIESPAGDEARLLIIRPQLERESRSFWVVNRNKRGAVLDLKQARGLEAFKRLVERADVLLHNFRPGVDDRMGIAYETLRKINPRLVYVAFSPYGGEGPARGRRGYDRLIQAASGILGRRKMPDGSPRSLGIWAVDTASAPIIAYAVMLALFQRQTTGEGSKIEGSLLQTALLLQGVEMVRQADDPASPPGDYGTWALNSAYACRDDAHMQLAVVQQAEWINLCRALEQEELSVHPDFADRKGRQTHSAELTELMARILSTRTSGEWEQRFAQFDVPGMVVLTPEMVFDHPQVTANHMFAEVEQPGSGTVKMVNVPFRLNGTQGNGIRPAPGLGQHTEQILRESGFSEDEIASLRAEGIIN